MPRLPLASIVPLFAASLAVAQGPSFVAPAGETVLNTAFTQVVTTTGPINVSGGLFFFDTVTIPAGATVVGTGPNPMIWVVNDMIVDGRLSADGGDGARVDTLSSAQFAKSGGVGGPAGGNGGAGTPATTAQSLYGQSGFGPGNAPGLGGRGGLLSFVAACGRGSGGGGGSFATAGDPWFRTPAGTGTSFLQRAGNGGMGCLGVSGSANRTLLPGTAGPVRFVDARPDNDFFGLGYDFAAQQFVQGELSSLTGGAGGGGGGDMSNDNTLFSSNWPLDASGGGGGGGGGCLVIVALNRIVVGDTGSITANGGHGGGGEQAGSSNKGGGGGGGSGGLLILVAANEIELHVKGETYANNDYDFVLSADGGVCRTSGYLPPYIVGKYPPNGQPTIAGNVYDSYPHGGFGGMGVVQMIAPIGNNTDGTNTRLDDNIRLFRNGTPLTGAEKQRYLAWRGFIDANGVRVDDLGNAIVIGDDEGDIRPTPHLLPLL